MSHFENVRAIFDKHWPQNIFSTSFTNGGVGGAGAKMAVVVEVAESLFESYQVSCTIQCHPSRPHHLGLKAQIVCEDASGMSEAAEVEETSIPGGEWRVMEAAEAAEVEEISIPGHSGFLVHISWNRRWWIEGDGGSGGGGDLHSSWYTFHGTTGSGWRVMEVAEVAERLELYVKI
ncbi:hypothetical protein B0H17DRAFT_1131911 [Mycena rosella]|uniref:Uncharacterized protein n=1 Tax=Mycena rosella TaxID=1033263 RepID=A0AAD7GMF2_MYCRO|nr:hypothetical protein B0H17DRAFT_1131911 [Mycena rosella]